MSRIAKRYSETLKFGDAASFGYEKLLKSFQNGPRIGQILRNILGMECGLHFEVKPDDGKGFTAFRRLQNGLEVSYADQQRHQPFRHELKNLQSNFGFTLALDGYVDIEIPEIGFRQRLQKGEILLRRGTAKRVVQDLPAGQPLKGIFMDVPLKMVETWRNDETSEINSEIRAFLEDESPITVRTHKVSSEFFLLAQRFFDRDDKSSSDALAFEALILELLANLISPASDPFDAQLGNSRKQTQKGLALEQAKTVLDEEWRTPPKITALARRVGLNECYLKSGFKDQFGMTVGDYVRQKRMNRARHQIEVLGASVQETALLVGYSNPSHFSSVYKKSFGYLPSEHGKKNQ